MEKKLVPHHSGGGKTRERGQHVMSMRFVMLCCFFLMTTVLNGQQKKVSVKWANTPLPEALNMLETSDVYRFIFNYREVDAYRVTADLKEQTVFQILDSVLKDLPFTYKSEGIYVLIRKKVERAVDNRFTVKGRVVDVQNQPMPGVTVRLDSTTVGTSTDVDGTFVLAVPRGKGSLVFSFVGYDTRKVDFEAGKLVMVTLKEKMSDLDEVVVRAYGTQNKREMVSAISTVKAEEMKELPTASITGMLQGRLAGVNIIQQSGAPGSAPVIAVRGFNSLLIPGASDGQPLWVVDGVPMHSFVSPVTGTNTLADLDPSMIESVQVLKDAAAASIYGSRAGNGVILVTTKKGKAGKTIFAANVSYTASQLMEWPLQTGGRMERWLDVEQARHITASYYDWMSGETHHPTSYEQVFKKGGAYDQFWRNGGRDVTTIYRLQDSLDPYYNNVQNWWKYVYQTGKVVNANIQASGGSDRFQYMIGAGYYDEEGIMINSSYRRANLISNLTARLTRRLRLDSRVTLSYVDKTMNKSGGGSRYQGMEVSPVQQSTYIAASKELEDEWLKEIKQVKDRTDDCRVMTSLFLEYDLWKGLSLSASGNIDCSQANKNRFVPSTLDEQYHENKSEGVVNRVVTLSTEELLRYHGTLGGNHNFDFLLGINANKEQNFYIGGEGRGGSSDYVYYYDPLKNPPVVNHGDKYNDNWMSMTSYKSNFTEKVMVSYFTRFGYNYKQRYLTEFSLRRDGSSTFGEGNRWANFPSVALGWAFSEEPFVKRWTGGWLNWGKIRASYGTSGQIFTDAYLAHGLMAVRSKDFFQGNPLMECATPISPDLTWEKTKQYDIGLDLDMFNYRFNLKLDYYYKYTSALIYAVDLPGSLYSQNSRTENAMEVSNEGIELEFKADMLRECIINWRMRFNVARNWNRFEKSYNGKDMRLLVIGRPLHGMYARVSDGFYESEDDVPRYYRVNGQETFLGGVSTSKGVSGLVGTYKLKDLNGDGQAYETYFAGSPLPLAHGGWVNELSWKGFDLNVLVNYTLGRKMINKSMETLNTMGPKFLDYRDLRYWTEPGCDANLPALGSVIRADLDSNIEKVNSLSLKQLTLGYNLPEALAHKAGFSGVRFFVTGENLFYLSDYSGANPEVIDVYSGMDTGKAYPLPRKWTLGLTLNF